MTATVTVTADVLPPLSEHQLLYLFLHLFLLLFTARLLGEIARYTGLPSVLGELLAGIVLGPSILGAIAPGLFVAIFPQNALQYHLVEVVSWIGLTMLLVVTGFETDLDLISSRAKPATYTAATGIAVPFLLGFGLAYLLPSEFLAADDQRLVFSLFIATALSISAIPVIAKVLIEMGVMNRDIGQITIASGMINDTVGWILLAVVASLARSGGGEAVSTAGETIVLLVLFLGAAITLGDRVVRGTLRWVDNTLGGDISMATTVMILALGVGTITQFLGLEAVLGAFVVGVLVGQVKRFDRAARHTFEVVTMSIFAPIFFATAGLRVDLTTLLVPTALLGGLAVLAVAIVGKFTGTFVGAKASGLSNWEGIAMGSGLNARGALEIIVATIGISVGVLTGTTYTIIVMVAIITSLLAPPLLRVSLSNIELSSEEAERLEREEREAQGFLGNVVRVLLPTRCSPDSQLAARLVGYIARTREMEATNMYVSVDGERVATGGWFSRRVKRLLSSGSRTNRVESDGGTVGADASGIRAEVCLETMAERLDLTADKTRNIVRTVEGDASETVVTEAADGYDLMVLGAPPRRPNAEGLLFSTEIDDVLRASPCPLLAVRAGDSARRSPGEPIRRILLPTVGNEYSRHAAEVAFAVATECGALVEVMHVVNRPWTEELFEDATNFPEAVRLGEDIVDREAELGRHMGAQVGTEVTVGERPERTIVERAMLTDTDLIVVGTEIRPASHRAFLGHRVEHVLKNAPCSVAVVSSP
ncbi:cation:proton antiporter [Haladaptatus sp. CMAA 1911]|uniref:cation:proton antiporter domain-containing protein n=1 Tax=unclassified Haladaptatus TaxID=2622732 RepID=UPI0037547367